MSVVHSYQPFPKAECHHYARGDGLEVSGPRRRPRVLTPPRDLWKWVRGPDEWTILSSCGRYKIRKRCVASAGVRADPQFTFEAFRIVKDHWDFTLGVRGDATEARKLCDANREAHP